MIKFSISSYEYGLETYTCFEVEESVEHVKNYFRLISCEKQLQKYWLFQTQKFANNLRLLWLISMYSFQFMIYT